MTVGLTSLAATLQQLEKDKSRTTILDRSPQMVGMTSMMQQQPLSPPVSPRATGQHFEFKIEATSPKGKPLSFWHDIPLRPSDKDNNPIPYHVNYINEVPKCTRKKYEVSTKIEMNPIKQDIKKGKLREYTKGDIYFNYGCLPRTWEDPDSKLHGLTVGGDNDPLDACEIGLRMIPVGECRVVKVLGVLCMIDEEEADWKLIVIDVDDPWAKDLNDINDVDRLLPGTLDQIREWWRTYKVSDGKPENTFGFDERFLDRNFAMDVIERTHEDWQAKYEGKVQASI